jgi:eukaryotic-like serine/threonine-protein kinase
MSSELEMIRGALADRYAIVRELGRGGMATVYLAEDLKHDRKVALKVLKPELAVVLGADRFVVEIKTTAALQHPNILPLFDSGTAGGFLYYVMPFIDGETLRDKLNRETQFGVEEAVRIATDVSGALDYAHRQGVIHRDIKPENILLHDGRPMVADFGIALALSAAAGGRMTETGLSLGTPHYMSPEQATADKEISGRSDIYSLASVLYEMLTGEPPHMGKSAQQIIMKIIADTPRPVTELRRSVPPHVAAAVAQALEKLPADRFATAADFTAALEGRVSTRATLAAASAAPRAGWWRRAAFAASAAAVALAALAGWALNAGSPLQVVRLSATFPESEQLRAVGTRRFDISRDGARIVYVGAAEAGSQLWIREVNSLTARPLPGTTGALAPFFSPDGNSVAYFTATQGDLRVVPIQGGPIQTIVRDSAAAWGGDWADDGHIYFTGLRSAIMRVPASGGAVEAMSVLDSAAGQREHDWVHVLPGGKSALIQIWSNSISDATIGVLDLRTGKTTKILDGLYGRWVASGNIVYATFTGALLAVPFDARSGQVTGAAVGVADGVAVDVTSGAAQFAVSRTGTLIYTPGAAAGNERIVWVDTTGAIAPVDTTWRGSFSNVSLSPDGSRAVVSSFGPDGEHIWVKELPNGSLTRLTSGNSSNSRPVWSPDGRRVAFVSNRGTGGGRNVWVQRADGSAEPESLLANPRQIDEVQWAPDGRTLVVRTGSGGISTRDVMAFTIGSDTALRPIAAGKFDEFAPDVSPDGRWVAYSAGETGRKDIYVRLMDDPGAGRWQVSADGGEEPRWAPGGRRIFYRSGRGDVMAADVTTTPAFAVTGRRTLFVAPRFGVDPNHRAYDVSRDGTRLLMIDRTVTGIGELVFVFNWFEDLRGTVSARR